MSREVEDFLPIFPAAPKSRVADADIGPPADGPGPDGTIGPPGDNYDEGLNSHPGRPGPTGQVGTTSQSEEYTTIEPKKKMEVEYSVDIICPIVEQAIEHHPELRRFLGDIGTAMLCRSVVERMARVSLITIGSNDTVIINQTSRSDLEYRGLSALGQALAESTGAKVVVLPNGVTLSTMDEKALANVGLKKSYPPPVTGQAQPV